MYKQFGEEEKWMISCTVCLSDLFFIYVKKYQF